jgi:hypothetical protein
MNGTAINRSLSEASVYASSASALQPYMHRRALRKAQAFRPSFVNMVFAYLANHIAVAFV